MLALAPRRLGTDSLEHAPVGTIPPRMVNAHRGALAERWLVTLPRDARRKYRAAHLTADGRGWLDDHRAELDLMND